MAINLNKITLEKSGDSHKINLSKEVESGKEIQINLNWSQGEKKGFLASIFGGNSAVDLDLGCFYELKNGAKSVIDGLQFSKGQGGPRNRQTRQGCFVDAPWIWHTGDDLSGGAGETIFVNPKGLHNLKRISIYCFIYEGVAKWAETNGVATIKVPNNPEIVVEMGKQSSSKKFCSLADIVFNDDNTMTVRKTMSFHNGHDDCDKAYGWGMNWAPGAK